MTLDVFTFGEAMIRLSVPPGETLVSSPGFDVHVAGAEANVAATLARLGRNVTWVSRLPRGPLGRRVLAELRAAGVDISGVSLESRGRIGIYFVELHAPPLPTSVIYDRAGSAASSFTLDDVPWALFNDARVIHLSGITPALSESCLETAMELADRARAGDALLSVDVNYRSRLWTITRASAAIARLMEGADLVVCTGEDAKALFDVNADPAKAAEELSHRFDLHRAVVTSADGAWWHAAGASGHVRSIRVSIVDRIGAGDAFTSGVLDGLLDDDLETGVRRGIALAAIALTTRGDQAITTREEMEKLLTGTGRRVDR